MDPEKWQVTGEIPAVVLFSLLHFQEVVSSWSILARQVKDNVCVLYPGFSIGFLLWLTHLTVDLVSAISAFHLCPFFWTPGDTAWKQDTWHLEYQQLCVFASQPQFYEISGSVPSLSHEILSPLVVAEHPLWLWWSGWKVAPCGELPIDVGQVLLWGG